jgi:hypothetical protein
MTIGFRMTAVMAGFLHFPVDISCSYFAYMSGLKRGAPTAGRQMARLTVPRPPWIRSLPCHFHDCLDMGARPANDAACFPVRSPSSGMSVRIAQAVTLAMPGMLVRMGVVAQVTPEA